MEPVNPTSPRSSPWARAIDTVVLLFVRVVVGGVFVAFGVAKALESPAEFMTAIAQYQVVPNQLLGPFAVFLTVAEIGLGVCFLLGLWLRQSMAGLAGLIILFMVAIAQTMVRGLPLQDCGCSGSFISIGDTPQEVLIRDVVLLVLLVWAWIRRAHHRWTLDSWFARPS